MRRPRDACDAERRDRDASHCRSATGCHPIRLSLSKFPAVQSGSAISGQLSTTSPGDFKIEALIPAAKLAAKSKLDTIGKLTRRGVKAGRSASACR